MNSKTILIRSKDRTNVPENATTSSNFVIQSRDLLDGTYVVKSVIIPNTSYNLHATNDTITLNETAPVASFPISLEHGNYNAPELASLVQLAFNSVGVQTFAVSVNAITGKLKVVCTSGQNFSISFPNPETSKTYGFVGIATTAQQVVLVGNHVVSLGYPESVGIHIRELTCSHSAYENIATRASGSIYVPLSEQFGFYKALMSSDLYQTVTFHRNSKLSISIVDPSTNQVVDLNGSDWEMLLTQVPS